jgi:hypothetical protein
MTGSRLALADLRAVALVAEHESVETRGRGWVHVRHDVLVGVGGERVRVVAETLLDDLGVLAVGEKGGVRVRRSCRGRIRGRPLSLII